MSNHQQLLTVKEETDILMYIFKQDGRLYRGDEYPYKGLCYIQIFSFNLTNKEKTLEEFNDKKLTTVNSKLQAGRETNLWQKFKRGRYAIIPCKSKNKIKQSQFEFRIYYDKDIEIEKAKGTNNQFDQLKRYEPKDIDKANYDAFLTLLEKYKK